MHKEKNTLTDRKNYHTFLTPYFNTTKGSIQLESANEYTVGFDKSIFFKEFTKKELKQYEKTPAEFE
ncbi:hypothetical protein [Mariniflexile sp.]|uniref:hypothetical protein n=1 Tax=Mariniflexile sp. TaxID=1979402 RepID=UPI0040477CF4